MAIDGYMIEVDFDGETLRVRGKNKAARVALAGQDHGQDIVLRRDEIERVEFKGASVLTNGNLRVTGRGKTYQLHFRKKQGAAFEQLAAVLA